ncbi:MAG: hypothetical protein EOO50_16140 [Flavobacterium sp.]|uniref:hypothetical protein n=1 Tax=Flavobacterium sp. TaxID=239 RepID=UPI0011FF6A34|nr:hypothetical protein [Flavobacterium sp.]RZJ64286.1 MAG: hypothetical protein EOO50_16140 [Flavobacterium sp.]
MKNVVMAVLMLVGVSGFAQEKHDGKRKHDRVELSPEQRNELRLKELTLKLDLNASQQKEMAKIISEQQVKRDAARAEMKTKRDNKEKPTADEVFARQSKMLDEQIAAKARMKKLLNDEQFDKWEKMREHKKDHFQKRMGKHREKKPEPQD